MHIHTQQQHQNNTPTTTIPNTNQTSSLVYFVDDLNMPHMDGVTLIRSLRALPAFRSTPILMLTTEFDAAKKAEGKSAGATGWLVKPFDPKKLVDVVNRVLG